MSLIGFPEAANKPVPPTLHLIWVGDRAPEWVARNWLLWARATSMRVEFWDNERVANHLPLSNAIRGLCPHPVVWADLARIEFLFRFGGIYLDSDMVPLRDPEPLAGERYSWVVPFSEEGHNGGHLTNAAMGFSPGHPVLARLWNRSAHNLKSRSYKRDFHRIAGPPVWDDCVDGTVERLDPVTFFPVATKNKAGDLSPEDFDRLRERYPDSYAVHEYRSAWHEIWGRE